MTQHEISQVQITMALSNEPARFSFLEVTGMVRVEMSKPVPKLFQGGAMFGKGAMRGDLFKTSAMTRAINPGVPKTVS